MRIRPALALALLLMLALAAILAGQTGRGGGAAAKKVPESSWADKHKKRKTKKKNKATRQFGAAMRKTANRVKEKQEKKCGDIVKAARAGDLAYLKPGGRTPGRETRMALKINCHDEHGYTPLHHAARKNHPEFAQTLVDMGADLEMSTTSQKWTPLHEAAYWGNVDIVRLLLDAGASVAALSHKGKTPLHAACQGRYGNEGNVVSMLIEGGAAVGHEDNQDETPLHDAAENDCTACAKHLLKAGANPEASSTSHKTPIDVADTLKFIKFAKMLRDHALPASGDNEEASAAAEGENEVDEVVDL